MNKYEVTLKKTADEFEAKKITIEADRFETGCGNHFFKGDELIAFFSLPDSIVKI